MAKTVKRTMYYPTFNPKTNDFDYKKVTHERPMTKQERKADFISTIFLWVSITIILISVILVFVGLAGNFEILGLCALGAFFTLSIITGLLEVLWIEKKIYPILTAIEERGFDAEILQWEQITQEQNIIAQEWRAEHKFEEAIRQAQETKNCNDIATLLRLYQSGDLKQ